MKFEDGEEFELIHVPTSAAAISDSFTLCEMDDLKEAMFSRCTLVA